MPENYLKTDFVYTTDDSDLDQSNSSYKVSDVIDSNKFADECEEKERGNGEEEGVEGR